MVHPSPELETSRRKESESSLREILALHKTPEHRKLYEAARKLKEDIKTGSNGVNLFASKPIAGMDAGIATKNKPGQLSSCFDT